MADSIGIFLGSLIVDVADRVFANAVNTVKKIPRAAGSSRPPLADRLLVYSLPTWTFEGECADAVVIWIV
jgi:hypothetical protein